MRYLATLIGPALALVVLIVASYSFTGTSLLLADDDHGDYRSLATPLSIGSGQVTGTISPTPFLFDVDYFSFEAIRGVRYEVVLDLVTVQDAHILVLNSENRGAGSSQNQILSTQDSQKKINWVARTTDTYFVEIAGIRDQATGEAVVGTYSLSVNADSTLEDKHSDFINGATTIAVGNVYQGAISPWTNQPGLSGTKQGGDDRDYFLFQVERGVKYTAEVDLGTIEGVEIAFESPATGTMVSNHGVGASMEWVSPSVGPYFVVISGSDRFRDLIGTYSVKLEANVALKDRHGEKHATATSLSFGNAHSGSISPEGDTDYFAFQARRGVKYTVQADLVSLQGLGLSVEDRVGKTVASNGGVGTELVWLGPTDNTYSIVVSSSPQVRDPIGSYSLRVDLDNSLQDRHADTAGDATLISFGYALQGAISPADDLDLFAFQAERGVKYAITADLDAGMGAQISVINPDGSVAVSNRGTGNQVNWTAENSGTYLVEMSGFPQTKESVGTYSITVEADQGWGDRYADSPNDAAQLSLGTVYQGAISPKGDLDYLTLEVRRGVKYSFELTHYTAKAVSLSLEKLHGEVGAIASNYGEGTNLVWLATENGNYAMALSGSPRVDEPTGTYSIQVSADTRLLDRHSDVSIQATPISLGNAIAGAISPKDDYDYFAFNAEAGKGYIVEVELNTAEAVRFSLSNADAGFSTSNFGTGTTVQWEAPISGRYILAVSGSSRSENQIGTYQVAVRRQDLVPNPSSVTVPITPVEAPSSNATGELTLVVHDRTASGSTVLVPIFLRGAPEITSVGFSLTFNPEVVEVASVHKGALTSSASLNSNTDTPGVLRLGLASGAAVSGSGSAAYVEFRVINEEMTTIQLSLSDTLATDSLGRPIGVQATNGSLTVGETPAGDGNGDGKVTVLDALMALRMSNGVIPRNMALDVNGDGVVTSADARQILLMARPG
jgi:hypothetical protein